MAIVNFSVPDDVKRAFDRAFKNRNKSALIAELMRRAVADAELAKQRAEIFRKITEGRARRPSVSNEQIRSARDAERS